MIRVKKEIVSFCFYLLFANVGLYASGIPQQPYHYLTNDIFVKREVTLSASPDGPRFHSLMMAKERADLQKNRINYSLSLSDFDVALFIPEKEISIVAVGDIMPGTNFPSTSYLPYSCAALFEPVKDLISAADVAIGNLEGVFSSNGGEAKNCKDPKTCYVFRMPDEYAECIKNTGFDILGLANNHINDFGATGRKNTVNVLLEAGFQFAGFPEYPYTIFEKDGLKIGFCAYAPHTATLNLRDYEGAASMVAMLDSLCDLVIVTFHGGAEGKDHQHVTRKDEEFLGYNRGNVYHFAHKVIDAGADLVIGHGPHVVRGMEVYKGKLIAYSLGNFCTYSRFNLSGPNANAPLLQVWLGKTGNFRGARINSFLQLGEGGPVPDPSNAAAKRIRELSTIDFPESPVRIDDEGWITIEEDEP